ncbi:hypothetical protein [Haloplanus pelagicus]|uniref:hypothetical protein n=1 Tax=Haloplanus pelagicus TaxID=2949995 RepID=UPI00203CD9A4|nr:hypothetical protein [Haloplanus sp. HW8-1]
MNRGSILGTSAHFGSDETAGAPNRQVGYIQEYRAEPRYGSGSDALIRAERAAVDRLVENRLARHNRAGGVLRGRGLRPPVGPCGLRRTVPLGES